MTALQESTFIDYIFYLHQNHSAASVFNKLYASYSIAKAAHYTEFFFVISAFGRKEEVDMSNIHVPGSFASIDLDWSLVSLYKERLYIDLGVNFTGHCDSPMTIYSLTSASTPLYRPVYNRLVKHTFHQDNWLLGFQKSFYTATGNNNRRGEDFSYIDIQSGLTAKQKCMRLKDFFSQGLRTNMFQNHSFRLEVRSQYAFLHIPIIVADIWQKIL
ncbi:hypothetical protein BDB01DRAFT_840252 [Pilobolus umbonatus]|nr:hypothetical protein BDB01DRAFT_840252 [Pilobolus umbonatus]